MKEDIKKKEKRLFYYVRIGPELMALLNEQTEKIKDVTYGVVGNSYWEAGEIIAKKFRGEI